MATNLFTDLAAQARVQKVDLNDLTQSMKWFKDKVVAMKSINANELMKSDTNRYAKTKNIGPSAVGSMMMFFYDPITKAKMPYFDRFPLIFVVQTMGDRFLGINLHYISPAARFRLLQALYTTLHSDRSEQSKLEITYKILKGTSRYRLYKPCLKLYLHSQVKSRFFVVNPSEWDMTVFLPIERFDSVNGQAILKSRVWADSMKKLTR